jgi:hypothetical protein
VLLTRRQHSNRDMPIRDRYIRNRVSLCM